MRVFYCDHYEVPLPERHRFPMRKYRLLREALLTSECLTESDLAPAPLAAPETLHLAHDTEYVDAFLAGGLERRAISRLGFPWSRELVSRCLASTGGTLAAAEAALEAGGNGVPAVAGVLAGGTHHAFRDFGAGYCAFNDIAVAAMGLLARGAANRILIVDLDVHQGDGTAAIFSGDERVFTFSMHGARNFPARKQVSDLDVALPDDTTDEGYLRALSPALDEAWDRAQPDFVFYQGGVDPLAEDRLGRLALTHAGLAERDERVFERARNAHVPITLTLGGGYAEPIEASIQAHLGTYRVARRVFS